MGQLYRANLGDLSGIVGVREEDGEEGERGSEVGFSFFLLSRINTSICVQVLIRPMVTKVKGAPSLSFLSLWHRCVKPFPIAGDGDV